jgi:hypothetical protein
MGYKEGVGVQRKLEGHMGCVFGRILGMVGYFSNFVSFKVGIDLHPFLT